MLPSRCCLTESPLASGWLLQAPLPLAVHHDGLTPTEAPPRCGHLSDGELHGPPCEEHPRDEPTKPGEDLATQDLLESREPSGRSNALASPRRR